MTIGIVLHRRILVDLTLLPRVCEALGLQYVRPQPASLAEGSSVILEIYQASLLWHDGEYDVEVLAMEGAPLIGMTLQETSDVRFQGSEGGHVSIGAL